MFMFIPIIHFDFFKFQYQNFYRQMFRRHYCFVVSIYLTKANKVVVHRLQIIRDVFQLQVISLWESAGVQFDFWRLLPCHEKHMLVAVVGGWRRYRLQVCIRRRYVDQRRHTRAADHRSQATACVVQSEISCRKTSLAYYLRPTVQPIESNIRVLSAVVYVASSAAETLSIVFVIAKCRTNLASVLRLHLT